MSILLVILTALTVIAGFLFVTRTRELKVARDDRDAYIQTTIDAEKRAEKALTEATYAKLTLAQVLNRPSVVNMSDDNIQQLGAIIESIIGAPDRMN